MPLHLDSLSRRRFLGGSAVFVLSPLLASRVRSAGAESWALLSDTHIAADPGTTTGTGVNMTANLRRVVAELLREKDTLSGVIIDGDCAYIDGQPGDYTTLLEILEPLREAGLPVHFTLGNHDDREAFASALGEAGEKPVVTGKRCAVIETPLVNWLLLDSLRHVNKVEGEFGPDQLAWVKQFLGESPDKPTILVGHHYPEVFRDDVIAGSEKVKISGLVDSDPFLALLASQPAAKAYVYGHSHAWKVKAGQGEPHQINLPPTAYVFDTALPNGWVRATVSATGLALELRALDSAHPRQGERHDLAWR